MQHAPAATIWPVSTSTGRASSPRPMSTCRRVDATIRPRLRPALVERDLAIVDPLLSIGASATAITNITISCFATNSKEGLQVRHQAHEPSAGAGARALRFLL